MSDVISDLINNELIVLNKIPKPKKHRFHTNDGSRVRVEAHRHPNGGGWVANTAKVDPAVYVSAASEVFDHAEIRGHVIMKGRCRVFGHAKIDGDITLIGDVIVSESARIFGNATIAGRIDIKNNVGIYGASAVRGEIMLCNNVTLHSSQVSGWGVIRDAATITNSAITGDFCVCNHTSINASTLIGRFMLGGTTAISTSRIVTHITHSNFFRKRLRKVSFPPPSPDLNSADLPANNEYLSAHIDGPVAGTTILRGRAAVSGSDIRTPLHCACTIALNRVNMSYGNNRAFVVTRPLTLTETSVSLYDLRNIFNQDATTQGRISGRPGTQQPVNNNATAATAAVPVFDPRGSRVIRV